MTALDPRTTLPLDDDDQQALAFALRSAIEGEVRFDPGSRHLYATDASNFRQVPIGVITPRSLDDVVAVHEVCRDHGAPVTMRGGGTSLAGQACNTAVVVDCSRHLDAIEEVDVAGRTALVQPGVVLDDLLDRIAPHDLTWGPRPSTHNRCTIGGMIGNDSCGAQAFRYGRVQDSVEALEVVLADGTRTWVGPTSDADFRRLAARDDALGRVYGELDDLRHRHADAIRTGYPDIPRPISGYSLGALGVDGDANVARALVGSEGTCATVLRARLSLHHAPAERTMLVLGHDDVHAAADAVAQVRHADGLVALEGIDQHLVDNMRDKGEHARAIPYLPDGGGWLLCEFAADTPEEARAFAEDLRRSADGGPSMHLYTDPDDIEVVWAAREAGLGVTAHFRGDDHWPGWEDSAVHPDDLGAYTRELRSLLDEHGYDASFYGHFGDGCLHCRIDFDLRSAAGVAQYRTFLDEAADLVAAHGGSLSGEHGDGQQRAQLLDRMFDDELMAAFHTFKHVWDPDNRMNPGKVVDADGVDEHLRLGADHRPWHPDDLAFAYPDDDGDFHRAALRCVGVGTCRRDDGAGTMCPSYMVTHEEQHSTRGRARLLFEMLQPDSDLDGWRDDSVREALDLCLSCKGCQTDCPVNVDMATYKAEFLHHHYAGRLHPRVHYALGLIDRWAAVGALAPGLANAALGAPLLGDLAKGVAGVTRRRPAPRFAHRSFRSWFADREPANPDGPPVILFPDTFVDRFEPHVGRATVRVLERAGHHVRVPRRRLCCGRPLYDYGFLGLARRRLEALVAEFRDDVAAGIPVVGMEPSCVATFRDELPKMLPHDDDARRLTQSTFMLGEFLDEQGHDWPSLDRRAIVHGHCHHKGALEMAGEAAALDGLGLDWEELDAGCCGLAGSFGFQAGEHHEVSVAAGERKLLPAVRAVPDDTLVVANGFSCRTQVAHLQDGPRPRRPLHLAEVLDLASTTGPAGPTTSRPEDASPTDDDRGLSRRDLGVLAAIGAAAGATATWLAGRASD
ncbi:FAD-binding and (Fe-S)-binding domain-containing protein [Salsipaludibacter albus]|uniref:FAD-binding and (Fe-S)-binding domain-containing protein n=1 Tax=Salsipaludibacter albus TaxID=2849650 RepID=UPI002367DF96|nr:FAD-binding and (Fe-S)-binding domain-containing protein [Salsipaludibacter albus]MBY5161378.1 FAD-binding protein [Salsipaludibacter albus]